MLYSFRAALQPECRGTRTWQVWPSEASGSEKDLILPVLTVASLNPKSPSKSAHTIVFVTWLSHAERPRGQSLAVFDVENRQGAASSWTGGHVP